MAKGHFITAYLQREIPMDIAVKTSALTEAAALAVGDLVKLTASKGAGIPAYIEAAAGIDDATHIIAQSDVTMNAGHVPVENRDYRYSDKVLGTITAAAASGSPTKHVALYAITDKNDIIVEA
jgi:hypothetical protein